MKLESICKEINNYFELDHECGAYNIGSNTIETLIKTYVPGQYIRIKNSILNDGIYKITNVNNGVITVEEDLMPENTGRIIIIYPLAIPKDFIELATEIIENGKEDSVQSESVSRYSVSYGEGGSSWTKVYAGALNKWRKLSWS